MLSQWSYLTLAGKRQQQKRESVFLCAGVTISVSKEIPARKHLCLFPDHVARFDFVVAYPLSSLTVIEKTLRNNSIAPSNKHQNNFFFSWPKSTASPPCVFSPGAGLERVRGVYVEDLTPLDPVRDGVVGGVHDAGQEDRLV